MTTRTLWTVAMHRSIALAVLTAGLCCAAPGEAFERSGAITYLEQHLIYDRVDSAYALRAEIIAALAQRADRDAWDKLILGLQFRVLASWQDPASDSSSAGPPPPPPGAMAEAAEPPPGGGPPTKSYERPSNLWAAPAQEAQQPPIDYAQQAVVWLKAAANEGLAAPRGKGRSDSLTDRRAGAIAADALGEIFALGVVGRVQSKGIEPDHVQAYIWFSLAAAENEAGAAANLTAVAAMLSPQQRAEADKSLHDLQARYGF